jgi:hypothetical protein
MDWTDEDTKILQLVNRCRQLISVRNPQGYQALTKKGSYVVRTKLSDYSAQAQDALPTGETWMLSEPLWFR